jgi:hypothetical protein
VADERSRKLERSAAGGDADAAERLYWTELRNQSTSELLDRMVEAVLTSVNKEAPTVWDKLRWLRGLPPEDTSQETLAAMRRRWSQIASARDLHRLPRMIRETGFTIYAREEREVYRYTEEGQWERLCSLSAAPPRTPFLVFDTLQERNDSEDRCESCLVLENGGVYVATVTGGQFSPYSRGWSSVRFEKGEA